MIVTFISQCEKKALPRTRRVLDAFANRIGDNTWQTVITEEGLLAIQRLLRKTASKNTAVACHRIATRRRTELIWIVGNRSKFDSEGIVPVNSTKKPLLQNHWENDWHYASSIQIIATIAALLHDIGKSTIGFQNKLNASFLAADPYRHEWISLKIFELIIIDCVDDEAWLNRFIHLDTWLASHDLEQLLHHSEKNKTNIEKLPPLAQWVAWLIVTHHRLPPAKQVFYTSSEIQTLKKHPPSIRKPLYKFYQDLEAFDYWVKAPLSKENNRNIVTENTDFWQFKQLVILSPLWQRHLKRWANKALTDIHLMNLSKNAVAQQKAISDNFLLYLSRLALMVGDHNYSSLAIDDPRTVKGDSAFQHLAANTDRKTRQCKQTLDEHLIGVATFTARFARYLPTIATRMPTIEKHRALEKNTNITRFNWQNRAFQIAKSIQKNSQEHGFFGINMASTGCGKTIANARIMYGLADPKVGARFTIALGLRVLTLQTGKSFRKDLHFSDEQLAILVGGTANTKLFEYQQQEKANLSYAEYENLSFQNTLGSESSEQLIEEILDSNIDYQDYNELNIDTILQDTTARNLLLSPVVSCTIDHIIQASECKRGGKFIAPMLRLLSSDLILDEPDDFDQSDLPALARLVYLAGVLGSRVLLSSATLPPDLMIGLYKAYLAGRKIFNHCQNKTTPNVVCAWFDEQDKASTSIACTDVDNFQQAHEQFILKRQQFLAAQEVRRKAEILPLDILYHHEKKEQFYADLATSILNGALQLHHHHSQTDPKTQKNISVGLVRIANIQQLSSIALQFFTQCTIPDDVHIHLACYHSKQLLILRNQLENKLDRILKRNMVQPEGIFKHIEIQQALEKSKAKQHIFIVLATPVAEVGRDHDYDWAIVEPSSMRSIIQLAGRVWRHRPEKYAKQSNILIMQYNIRYLRHQKTLKNALKSNQSIFYSTWVRDRQIQAL